MAPGNARTQVIARARYFADEERNFVVELTYRGTRYVGRSIESWQAALAAAENLLKGRLIADRDILDPPGPHPHRVSIT